MIPSMTEQPPTASGYNQRISQIKHCDHSILRTHPLPQAKGTWESSSQDTPWGILDTLRLSNYHIRGIIDFRKENFMQNEFMQQMSWLDWNVEKHGRVMPALLSVVPTVPWITCCWMSTHFVKPIVRDNVGCGGQILHCDITDVMLQG